MPSSAKPCHFLNLPWIMVGIIATAQAAIHTGKSNTRLTASTGSASAFITAHKGSIRVASMMFAPMMLPTESEFSFFLIAVKVVTSSGKEVPSAITVNPIMVSLMPIPDAMVLPEETKNSAPSTMPIVPKTNQSIFLGISFLGKDSPSSVFSRDAPFFPSIKFSTIKAMNMSHKIAADQTGKDIFMESSVSPTIAVSSKPPFKENSFLFTTPAIATSDTPIMRVVLAVTEPIALPIAS